jgi:hypothetical protein
MNRPRPYRRPAALLLTLPATWPGSAIAQRLRWPSPGHSTALPRASTMSITFTRSSREACRPGRPGSSHSP